MERRMGCKSALAVLFTGNSIVNFLCFKLNLTKKIHNHKIFDVLKIHYLYMLAIFFLGPTFYVFLIQGCRGDRVTSWRSFKTKGPKKTKTGMGLLKPPKLKQEKR